MARKPYRNKPKFGWRPPGIQPHRRHRTPGVKQSGRNLDGTGGWASTRGGIAGRVFNRFLRRWRARRRRKARPPALPKKYTVNVK